MVSIKEFFELREAGYTVDQIKEYSSFIEAPEQKPEQKPDQKPEQKPEQKPDPKPEQKPDPKQDPTSEQLKDVKDTLSMLLGAFRSMNINNKAMPDEAGRSTNDILAEIINPPGKGGTK